MKPLLTILLLFQATCVWAATNRIIVPPTSLGTAQSILPFAYDSMGSTGMRYQQVYGAQAFSAVPDGGWITAIAFSFADSGQLGGTIDAQIDLSTTTRPVDGLSTVFADNVGADNRVVTGPGTLSFFRNETQLSSLSVRLDLNEPFYYDPANGNLLMDVRLSRGYMGPLGIYSTALDASTLFGDQSSIVYADPLNSLTGIRSSVALVTGFTITAVPEPGATALFVLSLLTLAIFGVRKKQNRKE